MEMLVIAVIALVAFAAVLIPLFRRRPGVGDELEFENVRTDPEPEPGENVTETAPVAAPAAHSGAHAADDVGVAQQTLESDEIEREVLRYREALRAGTMCRRCGAANAPGSTYCMECGRRLPGPDAKEFE